MLHSSEQVLTEALLGTLGRVIVKTAGGIGGAVLVGMGTEGGVKVGVVATTVGGEGTEGVVIVTKGVVMLIEGVVTFKEIVVLTLMIGKEGVVRVTLGLLMFTGRCVVMFSPEGVEGVVMFVSGNVALLGSVMLVVRLAFGVVGVVMFTLGIIVVATLGIVECPDADYPYLTWMVG